MAAKKSKPVRKPDADRRRTRRFLYVWVPVICLVLICVYASALDPPRPTGRLVKGTVVEIKKSSRQPMSASYRIRLETGEEIEVSVPEKQKPAGGDVMVEEFKTALLKKTTYELRNVQRSETGGVQ